MATESEVIQKLRYQVDNYDYQHEHLPASEEIPEKINSGSHHVQLCSKGPNRTTISAYNITIHRQHGISDFLDSLSLFLKKNNWDSDVYSYGVSSNFRYFSVY
jgi:hypothetical protein